MVQSSPSHDEAQAEVNNDFQFPIPRKVVAGCFEEIELMCSALDDDSGMNEVGGAADDHQPLTSAQYLTHSDGVETLAKSRGKCSDAGHRQDEMIKELLCIQVREAGLPSPYNVATGSSEDTGGQDAGHSERVQNRAV